MSYTVWKPSPDMRLKTLEQKEQEFLAQPGPVLENFDELPNGMPDEADYPFKKIKARSFFSLESAKNINLQDQIVTRLNDLGNIRAFYYMLLSCCFPKLQNRNTDGKDEQRRNSLLRSIKIFVLSDSTTLVPISQQYYEPRYQTVLNDDRSMKKLILQSLLYLTVSQNGDVHGLIARYPIMDLILMSLIRTLVVIHHQYLPEMLSINKPISTDIIINSLRAQTPIKVEYSPLKQIILDDSISYRQENGHIILRLQNSERLRDSQCFKKTTETSDGNTESCKRLDTSKSLSDLLMMESKQEILKEPIKFINRLESVRRCDSVYSGGTQLQFNSSGDFWRRGSREPAQSVADDDSDLNMSYVVEKVAFGKPQVAEPKSPKKQSKFAYLSKNSVQKEQQSMHSFPTLVIHQTEEQPERSSNLMEPKVTSKLCTIPSVEQSLISSRCQTMKVSATPYDIEQQHIKNKIYEGTTSDDVLRIMSPQIARIVLKRKQDSVRSLVTTISQIKTAGSIRSSYDMNDDKLSMKMHNLCQQITRRSSITGSYRPESTVPLKKSMWDRKPPENKNDIIIPKLSLKEPEKRTIIDLRRKRNQKNKILDKHSEGGLSPPTSSRKITEAKYQSSLTHHC